MGRLGLALAVLALAFGAASTAQAQDKAKSGAPAPISKDNIARGMKEAPAAVKAANLPCTVTDAAYIGQSGKTNVYEVACREGLGYVLLSGGDQPAKTYDCLRTSDNASLKCRLPENADPKQALAPILAANGHSCTIKDARAIGSNVTDNFYEVACQEGPGYVIQTPAPGSATAVNVMPCEQTMGVGALECKLTSKAQSVAAIAAIAAKSGKTCQVSDARYIPAATPDHSVYYEVACGTRAGYVVKTDGKGNFLTAVDCASAKMIAGGCTMTTAAQSEAQEIETYTAKAKAGGFDCAVSKYKVIGATSAPVQSDIVELACSNRPDGRIAVLPTGKGANARFVDCGRAGEFGGDVSCTLTSMTPIYAKYTRALAARGRTTCIVSGSHYLGQSPSGTDFIETACTDGKPGWVMELDANDTVRTLLSCGQAAQTGLKCTLPTNAIR